MPRRISAIIPSTVNITISLKIPSEPDCFDNGKMKWHSVQGCSIAIPHQMEKRKEVQVWFYQFILTLDNHFSEIITLGLKTKEESWNLFIVELVFYVSTW